MALRREPRHAGAKERRAGINKWNDSHRERERERETVGKQKSVTGVWRRQQHGCCGGQRSVLHRWRRLRFRHSSYVQRRLRLGLLGILALVQGPVYRWQQLDQPGLAGAHRLGAPVQGGLRTEVGIDGCQTS